MRSSLDFSSLTGVLSTLLGIVLVSLVAVGVRLLIMQGVQQRRERQNRQINERLKTLIAAYKTLGGSFTGDLLVDPSHLGAMRRRADAAQAALESARAVAAPAAARLDEVANVANTSGSTVPDADASVVTGSDRRRRMRDAVEAALSDVILLGTEEQVRLAAQAARDMVAGSSIETAALVLSLRTFIRDVLDLEPIAADVSIPKQGPVRSAGAGGKDKAGGEGGAKGGGGAGGGGAGGGGSGGAGMMFGAGGAGGAAAHRAATQDLADEANASTGDTDSHR